MTQGAHEYWGWARLARRLGAFLVVGIGSALHAQRITIADSSSYLGQNRWNWKVFVTAPAESIAAIACVRYRLPSFFRDRDRRICGRQRDVTQRFQTDGETPGSFDIEVSVEPRHGRPWRVQHTIAVVTPLEATRKLQVLANNTSRSVKPNLWEWTLFITGTGEALQSIRCVEYRLEPSFYPPLRSTCARGAGDRAFALSSTAWQEFDVGVRLILTNGEVQSLTHHVLLR